LIFRYCK